MRRIDSFLATAVLMGLSCVAASASPIFGTFNMSGTITVSATDMLFKGDITPFTPERFTLTAATGSFVGQNGQNTVYNLNIGAQPVGSVFPPVPFITFNVIPGLPDLNINFIYAGTEGSADCFLAPAVPQHCTPPNPGGSPFNFTNNHGFFSIQSSANWVFTGVTSDGLSNWEAVFTSQFNTPFQTVLGTIETGGSVTNTYSGTVTVAAAVPEPASLSLIGFGVLLIAVGARRRLRKV